MLKSKCQRPNQINNSLEEFTGFAWMREKKIHQKIGSRLYYIHFYFIKCLTQIRYDFNTLIYIDDIFRNFRGTMDQRERRISVRW